MRLFDQLPALDVLDVLGGVDILGAETAPTLDDVRTGRATLREGMRGPAVTYVQAVVGAIADGVFGPATHKAVVAFQLVKGIGATGVVDAKTMTAVDALAGGTAGIGPSGGGASSPPSKPIAKAAGGGPNYLPPGWIDPWADEKKAPAAPSAPSAKAVSAGPFIQPQVDAPSSGLLTRFLPNIPRWQLALGAAGAIGLGVGIYAAVKK